MAVYTHDGVRHNTSEEALRYYEDKFLTPVPPFVDAYFLALHKHNFGRFELQAIPSESEGTGNLYLELQEYLYSNQDDNKFTGYNLIRYADSFPPDESEDLINFLSQQTKFVSMINTEVKEELLSLAENEDYFYDNENPELIITMDIQSEKEDVTKHLSYVIDGKVEGTIKVLEYISPLELLLDDIRSHYIKEISGEFKPNIGHIGKHNVDHLLSEAYKNERKVTVTVS